MNTNKMSDRPPTPADIFREIREANEEADRFAQTTITVTSTRPLAPGDPWLRVWTADQCRLAIGAKVP